LQNGDTQQAGFPFPTAPFERVGKEHGIPFSEGYDGGHVIRDYSLFHPGLQLESKHETILLLSSTGGEFSRQGTFFVAHELLLFLQKKAIAGAGYFSGMCQKCNNVSVPSGEKEE
jgi:hypothetical protein